MALVRWKNRGELTPWSALGDLEGQLGWLFDDFTRGFVVPERGWAPAVDLKETEDAYVIEADVPGLKKDEIGLVIVDNVVTLKGERKNEHESTNGGYHRFERRYGSFQRSFEIPGGFENDKVEANYTHGVLTVTLPKREEAKPKQIEVKVK